MSNLSMTQAEEKVLDKHLEQNVMTWVTTRQAEAEQLAMDSARLMACTTERLDRLKNQGFFKRCWNRFNGNAGAMERANVNDIIQMQKMSFRYVNMLQEQQLLMAHSLLSLKNNLNSLAVKEEQTRQMIGLLAERTRERFEKLEKRVAKVEVNQNLQGWLLGLEEREYARLYPTEYMRLFRVINDFYAIKDDNWDFNDLMLMRKAIRTVGLDPKWKLSIGLFLNSLTDEIQRLNNGHETYRDAITEHAPTTIVNYSQFAIENISSPAFLTLHGINTHYADKMEAIEALQDSLSISREEAMKTLLRQTIKNLNINLDYEFPLAETAIEILGCIRLADRLHAVNNDAKTDSGSTNTSANNHTEKAHSSADVPDKTLEFFTEIVDKVQASMNLNTNVCRNSFYTHNGSAFGNYPTFASALFYNLGINYSTEQYSIISDGILGIIDYTHNNTSRQIIPFHLGKKTFARIHYDEIDLSTMDEILVRYNTIYEKILPNLPEIAYQQNQDPKTNQQNLTTTPKKENITDENTLKAERENKILAFFANIPLDSNIYIKGRQNSSKVYNKLQKGRSEFGFYVDEDDILVYYDSTLFGGGGEGFILTWDTIYFKNSGHSELFDYEICQTVIPNFGGFKIDVGYEVYSVSCVSNNVRDASVEAIRTMHKQAAK